MTVQSTGGRLTALRLSYWLIAASLWPFFPVLSAMGLEPRGSAVPFVAMTVVAAAVAYAIYLTALSRPVRMDAGRPRDELAAAIADTFGKRLFLSLATAEIPAFVGLATAFAAGRLWLYALGFALALPILLAAAPTDTGVGRWGARLLPPGAPLTLRQALAEAPTRATGSAR